MKEKYLSEFYHIITNYNDQNGTLISNVNIREATNKVILEEQVIPEEINVTVDATW